MVRHIVADQDGKPYSYYQDEAQPHQVYYLPTVLRLPAATRLRTCQPCGSASTTPTALPLQWMMCKLTLAFAAAPVVDPDRLKAASDELRRFITDSLPVGVSSAGFRCTLTGSDKLQFSLALPPVTPATA